ncbi:peptidylprolyl isomerase [bacterium]|nr:peptidylprolyl isomerase [bacterium]
MKIIRSFRLMLLAALLAYGALLSAQEVIDRIVAIVDDEIILESEVFQYLQFSIGSTVNLEKLPQSKVDSMRSQILDELIDQKLLLARARLDTVVIPARQVDQELDQRIISLMDQIGGEKKLEEYYGMPLAKIKRQFRPLIEEGLMIDEVKRQHLASVRVTRSEVLEFWNAYRDSIPELKDAIKISHILLQDNLSDASIAAAVARADSARRMILNGEITFEEYAEKYSQDPGTAPKGGALGTTNRGDLVPEYEAAAYMMADGEISEPVVSQFGVHLIRLNSRVGEKINTNHILFKVVPAPADMEITMARADSIAEAIRNGADFTALALSYSTDSKTAPLGGDLGWYSPAELPAEFKEPLKNLKKGEVAAPFRTVFGVHIAKVTERVFSRPITIEEDYERIENLATAKKRDEVYEEWIQELADETFIERK